MNLFNLLYHFLWDSFSMYNNLFS